MRRLPAVAFVLALIVVAAAFGQTASMSMSADGRITTAGGVVSATGVLAPNNGQVVLATQAILSPGRYIASGVVTFAANSTGQRRCTIAQNGTDMVYTVDLAPSPADTTDVGCFARLTLAAGDSVQIRGSHSAGVQLTVKSSLFSLIKQ